MNTWYISAKIYVQIALFYEHKINNFYTLNKKMRDLKCSSDSYKDYKLLPILP